MKETGLIVIRNEMLNYVYFNILDDLANKEF